VRYHGIEVDDALEMAEQTEVLLQVIPDSDCLRRVVRPKAVQGTLAMFAAKLSLVILF